MATQFPAVPDLASCLWQLLAQVPAGSVTTPGNLAEAMGNKIAAVWVGHSMLHHQHGADCACHRVVRAGGVVGPYVTTVEEKRQRLAAEGVPAQSGVVNLDQFGFHDFISDRPLERLRQIQEAIQRQIVMRARRRLPALVGGVDVAYPNADEGIAAYALVETATGRLVWSATVRRPVLFPYVRSYLSFREIPILLDLLDEVCAAGRLAEIVLVDGTGILHHRRAGIASHLGVVASIPTIGVTKKLLCGEVDIGDMLPGESRPVIHQGEPVGLALRPTAGSRRPIFVSPGHRVDLLFCERLVRRLLTGRRLPEPVYWADRLGKAAKREVAPS